MKDVISRIISVFYSSYKPKYLLDENVQYCYGSKQKELFVEASTYVKPGTPDSILLSKAIKNNLTIITRDKKFILRALVQKEDIIFEAKHGTRFYIKGNSVTEFDQSLQGEQIPYSCEAKKVIELFRRTPFYNVPLDGFCVVNQF